MQDIVLRLMVVPAITRFKGTAELNRVSIVVEVPREHHVVRGGVGMKKFANKEKNSTFTFRGKFRLEVDVDDA